MNHSRARQIFEEIQARPYSLSPAPNIPSNNCYYKGTELIQRLGGIGYTLRGRCGETYWDPQIIPEDIVNLLPKDIQVTHFFPEVLIDGVWRIIDPTFQPSLAKYGFTIGAWEGTSKPCFPITKLYSHEKQLAYCDEWFAPDYARDFFERGGPCWKALDAWFAERA